MTSLGGATPRPSGVANSSCKVLGPSIYQQVPQWKSTYLHAHLQDSTALENNIGEREISAYFWFYRACDSCHAPAFIMKCLWCALLATVFSFGGIIIRSAWCQRDCGQLWQLWWMPLLLLSQDSRRTGKSTFDLIKTYRRPVWWNNQCKSRPSGWIWKYFPSGLTVDCWVE